MKGKMSMRSGELGAAAVGLYDRVQSSIQTGWMQLATSLGVPP